jgi:hypothetical protein
MKSIKCPRCGLVCWSGNEFCQRCEQKLWPGVEEPHEAGGNFSQGAQGGPQQAGPTPQPSGKLRFCKVCYFAHARTAEACPNCGHQGVPTLITNGIRKAVTILLVLLLFMTLMGAWRYYSVASRTDADMAAQYGIVETTVREQPQKPWFWSLFRSKPTVEEIFEHNVEASGGARVLRSITGLSAAGEISLVNRATAQSPQQVFANGRIMIQSKAPDKAATEMEVTTYGSGGTKQKVRRGFDGARGWEYVERTVREPGTAGPVTKKELREIVGADLEQMKHFGVTTGVMRLKDEYSSLLLLGQQKVGRELSTGAPTGARECYVVRGLNREKKFETFYFDIENGLLTRIDFEAEKDGETLILESYLEDYRDVGGVKLPFKLSYKIKELMITLRFNEFNLNPSLSDSIFALPVY